MYCMKLNKVNKSYTYSLKMQTNPVPFALNIYVIIFTVIVNIIRVLIVTSSPITKVVNATGCSIIVDKLSKLSLINSSRKIELIIPKNHMQHKLLYLWLIYS